MFIIVVPTMRASEIPRWRQWSARQSLVHELRIVYQGLESSLADRVYRAYPRGIGSARARNEGVGGHGPQDIYVFADDDVTADDSCLLQVQEIMNRDGIGGICGQVVTPEGRPYNRYSRTSMPVVIRPSRIARVFGAFIVIRADAFDVVGGFDERFGIGSRFGGMEEADLVLRVIDRGWSVVSDPQVVVVHPDFWSDYDLTAAIDRAYKNGRGLGALLRKHIIGHRNGLSKIGLLVTVLRIVAGFLHDIPRLDSSARRRRSAALHGIAAGWKDFSG